MEQTINYYELDLFPAILIRRFARDQRNLEEVQPLEKWQVKEQDLQDYAHGESCRFDLFFRFTDDDQRTPALIFQLARRSDLADVPEYVKEEELYRVIHVDPSIDHLFREYMDKERVV